MLGNLLVVVFLAPAVTALLAWSLADRPVWRDAMSLLTSLLPALLLWGVLAPAVYAGLTPEITLFTWIPGVDWTFTLEPLGLVFALVAATLWPVTMLYATGYLEANHEHGRTRFLVYMSLSMLAAFGIAFSANLFTLFFCYEALTFLTWPLVTHHQDEAAKRAGRVYLGLLLLTSMCLFLPAVFWTWSVAGTTDFRVGGILARHVAGWQATVLLLLFAFGIGKTALMPFHRWLPAAMVAPAPVSAMLHAVAVVKAGVFTLLKVAAFTFGRSTLLEGHADVWLSAVACVSLVLASFIALSKTDLKERLAYSTISQLGYIVLGAALAHPAGWLGAGLHIATHAVGKITLFFCAGTIATLTGKKDVRDFNGLGRAMPWTFGAFAVAALSITGLPPGAGLWSKWFLVLGAFQAQHPWAVIALLLSSVLNVFYLLEIVVRAFFFEPDSAQTQVSERAWKLVAVPVFTAALCVVLFGFAGVVLQLLQPVLGA